MCLSLCYNLAYWAFFIENILLLPTLSLKWNIPKYIHTKDIWMAHDHKNDKHTW